MTKGGEAAAGGDALTTMHLRRAREGSAAAAASLEWIVKRFTPLLMQQASFRLDGRLSGILDPEDVVMDVWRRTIPRLDDLKPRSGRITPVLMRFLSTTLWHRVRDLMEKHVQGKPVRLTRAAPDATDPLSRLPASTDPVGDILAKEEVRLVQEAIERLEALDREAVILRAIEQRSHAEAADHLGCSPEAAKQRYHRALGRLRKELPDSVFADIEAV